MAYSLIIHPVLGTDLGVYVQHLYVVTVIMAEVFSFNGSCNKDYFNNVFFKCQLHHVHDGNAPACSDFTVIIALTILLLGV